MQKQLKVCTCMPRPAKGGKLWVVCPTIKILSKSKRHKRNNVGSKVPTYESYIKTCTSNQLKLYGIKLGKY